MPRVESITAKAIDLPLLEPWETAQRRATTSPSVFIRVEADGVVGYGEAVPVRYVTGESTETVIHDVAVAAEVLQGASLSEYRLNHCKLSEALPYGNTAKAGVEMALFDALCKKLGVPLYAYLGGAPLRIETDVTIPICPPEHAKERAQQLSARGFSQFKIKVGKEKEEDFARVLAVVHGAPECIINIDANQGFEPAEAVEFVRKLQSRGVRLQLVEQPVEPTDLRGMRYVTENLDVPVIADESAQTAKDVVDIIRYKAATGVNVKVMKAGVLGALDIASICAAAGLQLMLGTMLESRLGQAASVHVACGTCAFSVFDLDSDMLLAEQPVKGGVERKGAVLRPLSRPGLGCEVVESAL